MVYGLARSGLGKIRNNDDLLWGSERTTDLPDLKDELLSKRTFIVEVVREFIRKGWLVSQASGKMTEGYIWLEGNKGIDSLVGGADDGSLSDTPVKDQSGFDLRGGETVSPRC